jgi:hypothetical protein
MAEVGGMDAELARVALVGLHLHTPLSPQTQACRKGFTEALDTNPKPPGVSLGS